MQYIIFVDQRLQKAWRWLAIRDETWSG